MIPLLIATCCSKINTSIMENLDASSSTLEGLLQSQTDDITEVKSSLSTIENATQSLGALVQSSTDQLHSDIDNATRPLAPLVESGTAQVLSRLSALSVVGKDDISGLQSSWHQLSLQQSRGFEQAISRAQDALVARLDELSLQVRAQYESTSELVRDHSSIHPYPNSNGNPDRHTAECQPHARSVDFQAKQRWTAPPVTRLYVPSWSFREPDHPSCPKKPSRTHVNRFCPLDMFLSATSSTLTSTLSIWARKTLQRGLSFRIPSRGLRKCQITRRKED